MVKILLVHVGSTWFKGIETFWDIWRLGIIQNSLWILLIILLWLFRPKMFCGSRTKCFNTIRPTYADSSCNQYIWLEYPNILVQKIMHEDLIKFKILVRFVNFPWMIFLAQDVSIPPNHTLIRQDGYILLQYLNMVVEVHSSTLRSNGSQFVFLKCDELIWPRSGSSKQKRMQLFWAIFQFIF